MPVERPRDPGHDLHGIDDTVVRPSRPIVAYAADDAELGQGGPSTSARDEASLLGRPAPRLLGLRVDGHDLVLDVPVVIGRRPAAPRVVSGPTPRLVAVPSPTHEVSGAHVEVRQHGDTVVVTDLRSTNGTRVIEPGRVPVVLRQGESHVARAGTIVDVGDGNLLEILPPQRIIPTKEPLL